MNPHSAIAHFLTEQTAGSAPVEQAQGTSLGPVLLLGFIAFLVSVVVRHRPPARSPSRQWSSSGSAEQSLPDHGLRREEFKKAAGTLLVTCLILVVAARSLLFG